MLQITDSNQNIHSTHEVMTPLRLFTSVAMATNIWRKKPRTIINEYYYALNYQIIYSTSNNELLKKLLAFFIVIFISFSYLQY
jgi:hypothetical protein